MKVKCDLKKKNKDDIKVISQNEKRCLSVMSAIHVIGFTKAKSCGGMNETVNSVYSIIIYYHISM
jgi:hypothetical protein